MIPAGRPKRSRPARPPGADGAPPIAAPEGAAPDFIARLVPLEPGFYAFSLAAETSWRDPVIGLALPAVQVCAAPYQGGPPDSPMAIAGGGPIEISDSFGRAGSWLGGRHNVLFVKSPAGGGAALVTAYLARDPESMPIELSIRRLDPPAPTPIAAGDEGKGVERQPAGHAAPAPPSAVVTLRLGAPGASARSPQGTSVDVVAHIRGRGDVHFRDATWVGRLGPGMWIEAFMILPRSRSVAAAIEYKGLNASGAETPWTGNGALCGARGQSIPLIGFAVRQKAVRGGALIDCEYTGYFQSGATAGPARNGAPCRSALENDPLEGMQLRITPRPAPPTSPAPARSGKTA